MRHKGSSTPPSTTIAVPFLLVRPGEEQSSPPLSLSLSLARITFCASYQMWPQRFRPDRRLTSLAPSLARSMAMVMKWGRKSFFPKSQMERWIQKEREKKGDCKTQLAQARTNLEESIKIAWKHGWQRNWRFNKI